MTKREILAVWAQAIGGGDPRPARRHLSERWLVWLEYTWLVAAIVFAAVLLFTSALPTP